MTWLSAHRSVVVPAAIVSFAVVLAFIGLGSRSLWFDEAMSVRVAQMPRDDFIRTVTRDELFTGLYYGFLRGWARVGDSELMLRLPSAIFAATSVGLTYLIGRRLFGSGAAVAGALILASHALLLQYAQEVRGYGLAIMLMAAASLIFLMALERPSTWRWIAYALAVVAAVYAHFFAVFVVFGHAVALLLHPDVRHMPWRRAFVAWVAAGLGTIPLGVWLLSNDQTRGWIPEFSLGRLMAVFQWLGGGNAVLARPAATVLAVIALAATVGALAVALLRLRRREAGDWGWLYLLAWLLVPIVSAAVLSVVVKPVLAERYIIVALPAFTLLCGALIFAMRSVALRTVASVAAAVVLAFGTMHVYGTEMKKPQWREAVAIMTAEGTPGDAVVVDPGWQWVPLKYALDQRDLGSAVDRVVTNPALGDPAGVIAEAAESHERLWLLVVDGREVPASTSYAYLDLLEQHYTEIGHEYVHRIGVYLFLRDS